jgi:hypothetical protein
MDGRPITIHGLDFGIHAEMTDQIALAEPSC